MSPLDHLFEKVIPTRRVEQMFSRANRAANWRLGLDVIQRVAGVSNLAELRDGSLERCDSLEKKVEDVGREAITAESLLADAGGLATELLALPAEIMLALRAVHRVGGCYGYTLDRPEDQTLILAIIAQSLQNVPAERLRTEQLIRLLEQGTVTQDDEKRPERFLENKVKDDMGEDLSKKIGSSLLEQKMEEGIPILGTVIIAGLRGRPYPAPAISP